MAVTGSFSLAICFALLLTAHAIKCYYKIEVECSPSGLVCNALTTLGNEQMAPKECGPHVTMCSSTTASGKGQDFEYEFAEARCLPKEVGANLKSGCYDRKDLEKIYPEEAEQFKQLEQMTNITYDTFKMCICDGNLCNGSIKSVLSISVIIWSVVTGFMLSI